jgi:16S rRNA (guanine1516-N2)-methyltransferase
MPPRQDLPEVTLFEAGRGTDLTFVRQLGIRPADFRDPSSWQLVAEADGLTLCGPGPQGPLQLRIEITQGPMAWRLTSSRKSDPLARAIGLGKRPTPPSVLDATAGLCRDAMVLAHLGCHVTAIERIPALIALVHSALANSPLAARLQLHHGDATRLLATLDPSQAPDVVYLDPMFGEADRAQVKKDMQVCRALAGPPDDPTALLTAARAVARDRVVVKRHRQDPPLAATPSFSIQAERIRYDAYLRNC